MLVPRPLQRARQAKEWRRARSGEEWWRRDQKPSFWGFLTVEADVDGDVGGSDAGGGIRARGCPWEGDGEEDEGGESWRFCTRPPPALRWSIEARR